MNRKILLSIGMIVFVVAIAIGTTGAFFSDSETSTGNTFTAGAIDLGIDNTSYYNGLAYATTTWALDFDIDTCINGQQGPCLFFSFNDLKPGDYGEDTISLHVTNNEAWLCADVTLTEDADVTCTEPENDIDAENGQCGLDGPANANGELADAVNFIWWADDGDNVLEVDETPLPAGALGALAVGQTATVALADSDQNMFGTPGQPILTDDPSEILYVGKAWCFGAITPAPLPQSSTGARATTTPAQNGDEVINPAISGQPSDGGYACAGSSVGNESQTDRVRLDVGFRAVQARHNTDYQCAPPQVVRLDVGAALADYDDPSTCDANVDDTFVGPVAPNFNTIQAAINDGSTTAGETICVAAGTYPEIVTVNKSVTIAGLGLVGSAVVNGGFIVDADSVTVKGLEVTGGLTEGTFSGFYIKSGVDTLTIRDNDIDGPFINDLTTSGGSRGIVNVSGVPISAILIENNTIHEWTSGIYTNPDTGAGITWTIRLNDIDDNLAGIGELNSALVSRNEFENSVPAQEAIGAGPTYDAISLVSENNFLTGTMLNTYVSIVGDVIAENNFWGPAGGAVQTGGTNEVDFTPEEVIAFPHN